MSRLNLRLVAAAIALLLLGIVAALTLTPTTGLPGGMPGQLCLLCGDRGVADLLENALLFLPIGVALRLAGIRPLNAAVLALMFAGSIEVLQLWILGRHANVRDAITNAFGAGLGAWLVGALGRGRSKGVRLRSCAWGAVGITIALVGLGGWLQRAAFTTANWYGQWTPRFAYLEPWTGTLSMARIAALDMPHGALSSIEEIRGAVMDASPIKIAGTMGAPTSDRSAIFAITDEQFRSILLVGAEGQDLVLRFRRRADAARLDAPSLIYPSLLAAARTGEPFLLTVTNLGDHACATVNGIRACAQGLQPGRLWTLLRALPVGPFGTRAMDAVALALLVIPVGYFLTPGPLLRTLLPLAGIAVGIPAAAAVTGLQPLAISEWIGLVTGIGIGSLIARLSQRV